MGEDLSIVQRDNYKLMGDNFQIFDSWEEAKEQCVLAPKYLEIDGELFIRQD